MKSNTALKSWGLLILACMAPAGAQAQVELALMAHRGQILNAAYSPNGHYLATASNTESVVWDMRTAHAIKTVPMATTSNFVTDDGKTLIVMAHSIMGVDIETNEARFAFGEDMRPRSMAVTPDGGRIAAGGETGTVMVWDVKGAQVAWSREGHEQGVSAILIHRDGSTVISGDRGNNLTVWSTRDQSVKTSLVGHTAPPTCLALSADGVTLVSGSQNELIFWDIPSAKATHSHKAHVFNLDMRADNLLAAATATGLQLWSAKDHKAVATYGSVRFFAASFDKTGKKLVTSADPYGSVLRVLDVDAITATEYATTSPSKRGHSKSITALAVSRNSANLASASEDTTVKLWNIESGLVEHTLQPSNLSVTRSLAFNRRGDVLLAASGKEIVLYDVRQGQELQRLQGHAANIVAIDIDSAGKTVMSASEDGSVRLWHLKKAKEKAHYTLVDLGDALVIDAALHPKARTIAVLTDDGALRMLNARNGKEKKRIENPDAKIRHLRFDSKGRELVTVGEDGVARLWKAAAGKVRLTGANLGNAIDAVAFEPSGKKFATGGRDGSARIFDSRRAQQKMLLSGHYDDAQGGVDSDVRALVYSHKGKRLMTGSGDRSIKIWDTRNGTLLGTLSGFVPYELAAP